MDYKAILESISDGVFTVNNEWKITSFNRAAEQIIGVKREEALGALCSEVFRSSICGEQCALRSTLQNGKALINRACYFINSRGEQIPITLSTAVLRDDNGKIIGGAETFRDMSEIESLKKRINGDFHAGDLESRSEAMRAIFQLLTVAAPTDITILICGETGTGKEVTAREIHHLSTRKDAPFIAVNCAALPENLLESELFGHKKGAFTGAVNNKKGLFCRARSGTLFLDEIGDISPALQVRLLRVLQEKEFEPLGSSQIVKSDVRIIAATNKNLKELVAQGKFREDLYYRLNVMHFELPPLRERKEDIPFLAELFIMRFNAKYKFKIQGISPEAMSLLLQHLWLGNIRELENAMERAVIVCAADLIEIQHLPQEIQSKLVSCAVSTGANYYENREAAEKNAILEALRKSKTKQAAADLLGIHKTTLFKKIRKYKL